MDRHHPVIAFLLASPFEILDLTGPSSVFERATANGESYYSIRILSTRSGGTVETAGGMAIGNVCKYSDYAGSIDTLIAIGGDGAVAPQSPELSKWLQERAPHIRRIASFYAGTFLLAGAGLLDGHRVATHWQWCDVLQSRYKHLKVERDPIFIKEGKFYTTAGVTAGIDLSLALVEEDLGHAVAAAIARILVLFLRRPGTQSQYSTLLAQQEGIEDVRMRDLPVWVKAHLSRKLDVEELANAAAMSPRTFMRQFKAQFNTTPARWVQSLRVEAAMQHLEDRTTSLSRIARITGFRDEQALRRAFVQQIAVTPKQYRQRFGELPVLMDYIEGVDPKLAKEALRERGLGLRQITETIPEMLWSSAPDGSIDYCNGRLLEFTGFTLAKAQGTRWIKLLHPDDVEHAVKAWRHCVRTGDPYRVEVRTFYASDHSYRWCATRAVPLLDSEGRIVKWFGSVVDMHDLKVTQEELRSTQAELAKVSRVMTVGR